jgi:lysophospholipase L1-like esterase
LTLFVALLFGAAFGQAATVTLSNLTQTYNGSPRAVTVTKDPANLAVSVVYQGVGGTVYPTSATAPTNVGNYLVTASYDDEGAPATVADVLIVSKASQTIAFTAIGAKTAISEPFALDATASSGLPVVYTVTNGASLVSLSGSTVTVLGAGSVTIRASQAGNANFEAAPNVNRSFTISAVPQVISFPAISDVGTGAAPIELAATATSGLPVSYSIVSGAGSVSLSGSTLSILGAGAVTVRASQAGDSVYAAATPVDRTFNINASEQTITFEPIANYGDDVIAVPLVATASSGLPVSFSVVSGPAAFVDGKLKLTGQGQVTIRATQEGNEIFDAATPVERSFTAEQGRKRILAIGNSFTQGGYGRPGYRNALIHILRGNTVLGANPTGTDYYRATNPNLPANVGMLGSQTTTAENSVPNSAYPDTLGLDPSHEGHYGWTAGNILFGNPDQPETGKLADWLAGYDYRPNIVYLNIGTVEALYSNADPDFAAGVREDIEGIIDTINAFAPNAYFFVAKIPPGKYTSGTFGQRWQNATNVINGMIDDLVADKNAIAGKQYAFVVDQFSDFNPDTMLDTDGIHPNTLGEEFLAASFFRASQWALNGSPAAPTPPPYTGAPRILALGDGITQGGGGHQSYRLPLLQLLSGESIVGATSDGSVIPVNFVGTMTTTRDYNPATNNYSALLKADPQHEGHAGWMTGNILTGFPGAPLQGGSGTLAEWLKSYTPDLALIHLGTWDVINRRNIPGWEIDAKENLRSAINLIRADNSSAVVFIAKVIPLDASYDVSVALLNSQITTLAAELNAERGFGWVFVVDHNTGFDRGTMLQADLRHPNAAGDAFMAARWYDAIKGFLTTGSLVPTITSGETAVAKLVTPFSFQITATSAPSSFSASGLPAGLSLNPSTGVITGEPLAGGTFTVLVGATNGAGTATKTMTITVEKGDATVTLANLAQTFDGAPKPVSATTEPAGLNVTFTYAGSATVPTQAGSYAVEATIVDTSYAGSATGTLVIGKAAATVTLGNTSFAYTGEPAAISATTVPAGLNVVYSFGGSSVIPSSVGSYAFTASIDDTNYSGSANGTLTIAKANQTIVFEPLQDITANINFVILSATASSGLPVSYTVVSGPASLTSSVLTPTGVGNVVIRATQAGDANFNAATSVERTLRIVEASAGVSISNLLYVYDGTPKTVTVTTNPAGLPVTITYGGSANPPVNAGSYPVLASVNNGTFAGSQSATLVIQKASATVSVDGLVHKYDGSAKSVTTTTVPSGLPVTVTYNGSTTLPTEKGTYAVMATVADPNYSGSATGTLSIGAGSQLVNLSSRALVGAGDGIMIPGFVIGGSGTKSVLIRGLGPLLGGFGVEGFLETPRMRIVNDQGAEVAVNQGWSTAPNAALIESESARIGAEPLPAGSGDCAVLLDLPPGGYTVQLAGVNNTTGVGLVEIYDLDEVGSSARLVNISSRSNVGVGADILIPGYVISGDVPRKLLVRASGPTIAADPFFVSGVLADPTLTIYTTNEQGESVEVAQNNDWGTNADLAELAAATTKVGAFEQLPGSKDSAIVVTLAPGVYTVQVSGVGGSTGVALVEIYEVDE